MKLARVVIFSCTTIIASYHYLKIYFFKKITTVISGNMKEQKFLDPMMSLLIAVYKLKTDGLDVL